MYNPCNQYFHYRYGKGGRGGRRDSCTIPLVFRLRSHLELDKNYTWRRFLPRPFPAVTYMCIRVYIYMYIRIYTIGHDVTGKNEIFHATIKRLKAYIYIYTYIDARVRFICIYTNPIQAPSFCIRTRSTLKKHRVSLIIRHYEKPVSLWIRLDNYDSTRNDSRKSWLRFRVFLELLKSIDKYLKLCEYNREKKMKNEKSWSSIRCYVNFDVILMLMLIVNNGQ